MRRKGRTTSLPPRQRCDARWPSPSPLTFERIISDRDLCGTAGWRLPSPARSASPLRVPGARCTPGRAQAPFRGQRFPAAPRIRRDGRAGHAGAGAASGGAGCDPGAAGPTRREWDPRGRTGRDQLCKHHSVQADGNRRQKTEHSRPVPATWRRLAGATGSFAPIVRRRESRSASQIVLASCAAASAAVTPH